MKLYWTKHALKRVWRRADENTKRFKEFVQQSVDGKTVLEKHVGPTGAGYLYVKYKDLTYKLYFDSKNRVITVQHGVYGRSVRNLQ